MAVRRAACRLIGSRVASRLREPTGNDAASQTARRGERHRAARSPGASICAMTAAMARTATRERRIGDGDVRLEARYVGRARDGWRDAYHHLLTMPLWAFFGVMG